MSCNYQIDLNLTTTKASIECNNQDLLRNCGINPNKHILLPEFHQPNSLTWTRMLGPFGLDKMNNCSERSFHYSLTCRLHLYLKEDPKHFRYIALGKYSQTWILRTAE